VVKWAGEKAFKNASGIWKEGQDGLDSDGELEIDALINNDLDLFSQCISQCPNLVVKKGCGDPKIGLLPKLHRCI
jgi:hypothetical protein